MNEGNVSVFGMEYIHVIDCTISKQVNEHGNAKIRGYIEEQDLQRCKLDITSDKWLAIQVYKDDFKTAFSGNIKNMEVKHKNEYYEVDLELIGETFKMDLIHRIRVFQSGEISLDSLLNIVDEGYGAIHILEDSYSKSIGKMTVQYKETDWSFIKRVASEMNGYVIPYYKNEGCRYVIGICDSNSISIDNKIYTIKDNINLYNYKVKNGLNIDLHDEEVYIFDTNKIYEIGDSIVFNGKPLYVHEVRSVMDGADLVSTYFLKYKNGFKECKVRNYSIIGASLMANVTSIKNDVVSVNYSDVEFYGDKVYPYSTVYSSKSGAGWYCMPEVGDSVRVYFPTEECEDCYTISSKHIQIGDKTPSTKFLRNPQNKEIVFSQSQLKITNNAGLNIILDDEKGIEISSNKSIKISADEDIRISSSNDKVIVDAKGQIELLQGDSKISVDENVSIVGKQVHIQNV